MTGRELAPDSRSSPRAVVKEVEGLRDSMSLTCRRSCLSSPFTAKIESIFMLFSKHNGSLLREQARGVLLTYRRSCLSSPFTTKKRVYLCFSASTTEAYQGSRLEVSCSHAACHASHPPSHNKKRKVCAFQQSKRKPPKAAG